MSGKKIIERTLTHPQKVRFLYKTILKLHRGLPIELKAIGDEYTKAEFRRHKDAAPDQTQVFMSEWANYAVSLTKQLGLRGHHLSKPIGKSFEETDIEKFSGEQIYQLYELYSAATTTTKDDIIDEDKR